MERKWSRFEILISPKQRAALNDFADEIGLTPSALVKLAIGKLLTDHDLLPAPHDRRAA